jgi:hypothetical protein
MKMIKKQKINKRKSSIKMKTIKNNTNNNDEDDNKENESDENENVEESSVFTDNYNDENDLEGFTTVRSNEELKQIKRERLKLKRNEINEKFNQFFINVDDVKNVERNIQLENNNDCEKMLPNIDVEVDAAAADVKTVIIDNNVNAVVAQLQIEMKAMSKNMNDMQFSIESLKAQRFVEKFRIGFIL